MSDELREIFPSDRYGRSQMDALLQQEGIRRDENLDYSCGLFDESEQLVATGSCFGNTIRCLAVSSSRQGEGLLNQIVSHLLEIQSQRGNAHLFLYTKCQSARFFSDLGFREIARVANKLVFMENRRTGFPRFCDALPVIPGERIGAVVMNANPFTLGHRYLVEQACQSSDHVHVFLLSEEAGPIPFAVRYRLVQEGLADLPNVSLHPSGPYLISSATFPSYFLRDSDEVIRTQAALDAEIFSKLAARLNIRTRFLGQEQSSHVTAMYNAVLSERLPQSGIDCRILPRLAVQGRTVSASTVRQAIHDHCLDSVRDMLPESTYRYFAAPESLAVRQAIQSQQNVIHY